MIQDGRNILINTGLPEIIPEEGSDFENGQDVTLQLASIGLTPDDIDTVISTHYDLDHAGRHAAFKEAQYVVQRGHHLDAASNPRFAATRPQWDQAQWNQDTAGERRYGTPYQGSLTPRLSRFHFFRTAPAGKM